MLFDGLDLRNSFGTAARRKPAKGRRRKGQKGANDCREDPHVTPALCCILLLFLALPPKAKSIAERSQEDRKDALSPHHVARMAPDELIANRQLISFC